MTLLERFLQRQRLMLGKVDLRYFPINNLAGVFNRNHELAAWREVFRQGLRFDKESGEEAVLRFIADVYLLKDGKVDIAEIPERFAVYLRNNVIEMFPATYTALERGLDHYFGFKLLHLGGNNGRRLVLEAIKRLSGFCYLAYARALANRIVRLPEYGSYSKVAKEKGEILRSKLEVSLRGNTPLLARSFLANGEAPTDEDVQSIQKLAHLCDGERELTPTIISEELQVSLNIAQHVYNIFTPNDLQNGDAFIRPDKYTKPQLIWRNNQVYISLPDFGEYMSDMIDSVSWEFYNNGFSTYRRVNGGATSNRFVRTGLVSCLPISRCSWVKSYEKEKDSQDQQIRDFTADYIQEIYFIYSLGENNYIVEDIGRLYENREYRVFLRSAAGQFTLLMKKQNGDEERKNSPFGEEVLRFDDCEYVELIDNDNNIVFHQEVQRLNNWVNRFELGIEPVSFVPFKQGYSQLPDLAEGNGVHYKWKLDGTEISFNDLTGTVDVKYGHVDVERYSGNERTGARHFILLPPISVPDEEQEYDVNDKVTVKYTSDYFCDGQEQCIEFQPKEVTKKTWFTFNNGLAVPIVCRVKRCGLLVEGFKPAANAENKTYYWWEDFEDAPDGKIVIHWHGGEKVVLELLDKEGNLINNIESRINKTTNTADITFSNIWHVCNDALDLVATVRAVSEETGKIIGKPLLFKTIKTQQPDWCIFDGTFSSIPDGILSSLPDGISCSLPDGTLSSLPDGTLSSLPEGTLIISRKYSEVKTDCKRVLMMLPVHDQGGKPILLAGDDVRLPDEIKEKVESHAILRIELPVHCQYNGDGNEIITVPGFMERMQSISPAFLVFIYIEKRSFLYDNEVEREIVYWQMRSKGIYVTLPQAELTDEQRRCFGAEEFYHIDQRDFRIRLLQMFQFPENQEQCNQFIRNVVKNAYCLKAARYLDCIVNLQDRRTSGYIFQAIDFWMELFLRGNNDNHIENTEKDLLNCFDDFWSVDFWQYYNCGFAGAKKKKLVTYDYRSQQGIEAFKAIVSELIDAGIINLYDIKYGINEHEIDDICSVHFSQSRLNPHKLRILGYLLCLYRIGGLTVTQDAIERIIRLTRAVKDAPMSENDQNELSSFIMKNVSGNNNIDINRLRNRLFFIQRRSKKVYNYILDYSHYYAYLDYLHDKRLCIAISKGISGYCRQLNRRNNPQQP